MKLYIPQSYVLDSRLEFVRSDGIVFGEDMANKPIFDKVRTVKNNTVNLFPQEPLFSKDPPLYKRGGGELSSHFRLLH